MTLWATFIGFQTCWNLSMVANTEFPKRCILTYGTDKLFMIGILAFLSAIRLGTCNGNRNSLSRSRSGSHEGQRHQSNRQNKAFCYFPFHSKNQKLLDGEDIYTFLFFFFSSSFFFFFFFFFFLILWLMVMERIFIRK
jgi:hypothetical protein